MIEPRWKTYGDDGIMERERAWLDNPTCEDCGRRIDGPLTLDEEADYRAYCVACSEDEYDPADQFPDIARRRRAAEAWGAINEDCGSAGMDVIRRRR